MHKVIIKGGRPLEGKVRISGAKNASLAILCASLMADKPLVLENIPYINDVKVLIEIIGTIGAKIYWQDYQSLYIEPPEKINGDAPYELVKKLRASNLLLGPMLAKFGCAKVSLPGGCNIGSRPMDLHFKGLRGLGAEVSLERGHIIGRAGKLTGTQIYLDFPSVGATENIMMAACLAEGQTIIENVAKEPEIVDLANFLNAMGAKVRGAGTDIIKIEGVTSLDKCQRYSIIPDRIEAGTYMVAAAATRGNVLIENVIPKHVEPLIAKLREANVDVEESEDTITVTAGKQLKPVDIKTLPYPGFPTDLQSQMMVFLSTVPGTSVIIENIFENRFQVADELKRLGAKIKVEGRMAVIEGGSSLHGAHVKATDLRAGAALVIAGLAASGETHISNAIYIYRGYQDIENKLKLLGAEVRCL
ncbi:UDP-N-acetylglucosamine 1-carboxyvinyltransferase [Desulfohalotomaculum tongense]|uniref:UDP-N-acetylglucosamine 1-carboxyvinyltransferase n=1 Tax=Desulforadius tongensis TaxID=1216062 RepID=UPI00195BECEC|nr:UDP-N-acetylglucosamine 1-carboxyvinyltransferase [Desulforadius tongensis]MBM7853790.1 UDP-N-acetylglucosamine 1-carboxyvinyltransferase [Desulforadius tongensis]